MVQDAMIPFENLSKLALHTRLMLFHQIKPVFHRISWHYSIFQENKIQMWISSQEKSMNTVHSMVFTYLFHSKKSSFFNKNHPQK